MNHNATDKKPPTRVITIHDLDREIEALRAELNELVALKKSLTMSTPELGE